MTTTPFYAIFESPSHSLSISWGSFRIIKKEPSWGLLSVPVSKRVLMFLLYMVNQYSFREVLDKFDVSQSSAHRIIQDMMKWFAQWEEPSSHGLITVRKQHLLLLSTGSLSSMVSLLQLISAETAHKRNRLLEQKVILLCPSSGDCQWEGFLLDHQAGLMLGTPNFYSTWKEKIGKYSIQCLHWTGLLIRHLSLPNVTVFTDSDLLQNSLISHGSEVV